MRLFGMRKLLRQTIQWLYILRHIREKIEINPKEPRYLKSSVGELDTKSRSSRKEMRYEKQRIFLHTLILVSSSLLWNSSLWLTKYANVKAKMSIGGNTRISMRHLVTDSLQDIVAQYLYIKNFSDNKKKFLLKVVSMEI